MADEKSIIVVFAKEPDGVSAKTRIAAKAGMEKAASVYRELLEVTGDILEDRNYSVCYYSKGERRKR